MGKLGLFIEEIAEKTTKNNQYEVLTSSQNGIISQEEYFNKQVASVDNTGYKIIRRGQFTYRSMSDTGRFYINRLINKEVGIVSPAYPVFKLVSNKLDPEYLELFFQSEAFQRQISDKSSGSTRLALRFAKLKNVEIDVPSIEIQRRIVSTIKKVKATISTEDNELVFCDELIKSRFIELFGNPDLSPQKADWQMVTSFSQIVTGTTPATGDPDNWDGDILWVTPAEIEKDAFYLYDTERKITEKGRKSKSLSLMPKGTIILSTRAPIGKVAIVGKEMACNQGFKNFVCKKNVNPVYLYFLLKYNTDYLNSIGSGTTFKEISKSKIEALRMPIPNKPIQDSFALFVTEVDKLKFSRLVRNCMVFNQKMGGICA